MTMLPVSGANEWSVCPMWATMREKYSIPESSSNQNTARIEGLMAHDMVELYIKTGKQFIEGEIHPTYNLPVTDEMLEFFRVYINFISTLPPGTSEESFKVPSVHEAIQGRWDYVAYDANNNTLHVVDGKFGHGVVEEYMNKQLLLTAEGFIDKYKINTLGLAYSFTIIQTRAYSFPAIRTWKTTYEDTRFEIDKIRTKAKATQTTTPPTELGKTCRKCPGRHACSSARSYVWGLIGDMDDRAALKLSPKEAAQELAFLENYKTILDARVEGLRAQVEFDIRRGEAVEWYRLSRGRAGNLKWKISDSEVEVLGQMYNAPLIKKSPITPTQAKRFIDIKVIENFAERGPGKEELERVTAKTTEKEFAEINSSDV